jgi:glycosyltransferase involved in cell wall biosynthesis
MSPRLHVHLVYDVEHWVLHTIATDMVAALDGRAGLRVTMGAPGRDLRTMWRQLGGAAVVHFLSPWNFFDWAGRLPTPTVVTIHHMASRARELAAAHLHAADAIHVTNQGALEDVKALAPAGLEVEPRLYVYPLRTALFQRDAGGRAALCARLGLSPDEAVFLLGLSAKLTSNEDARKGIDCYWDLLRALAATGGPRVMLVVFGPDAGERGGWDESLVPGDVAGQVRLVGRARYEELPALYSGLDAYVCLSRLEGGPYPVMECLSCGVPVLSTPVGSVPPLAVPGGALRLVDAANPVASAAAGIRALMESTPAERLRQGEVSRAAVEARHGIAAALRPDAYRSLYDAAVTHHRSRPLAGRLGCHWRLRIDLLRGAKP